MTAYRQTMTKALQEMYLSEDNVDLMRKAAGGAMQTIKMKDGKLKMDMFTASAIMQVYDKVNPVNQKKMAVMINKGTKAGMLKLQSFAMKQVKSEYGEEEELDEANFEIKNGKLHISKADYAKKPKEYKGKRNGKPTLMALDPKTGSTTSFEVVLEEVELDEKADLKKIDTGQLEKQLGLLKIGKPTPRMKDTAKRIRDELKSRGIKAEELDLDEDNMDLMRKAAKGAMQTIKFKDGKLKMDSFTASGIMAVYDKVNPKNKVSIEKMINSGTKAQIMKLQDLAMKASKGGRREEVELEEMEKENMTENLNLRDTIKNLWIEAASSAVNPNDREELDIDVKNSAKKMKRAKEPVPNVSEELDEASGDKEAYQKFFNATLKKFKVSSPADLKSDEEKKKFFDYIDKNWEGDNEKAEELIQLAKEFKVSSMREALAKVWGLDEGELPPALKKAIDAKKKDKEEKDEDKEIKGNKTLTGKKAAVVEIDPGLKTKK